MNIPTNQLMRSAVALALAGIAGQAAAQITFYEHDNYDGRSFTTSAPVTNFERIGFNDRASSVVVDRDTWEICDDAGYQGRCIVLRPGRYPSLNSMGMNDRVSSVRQIDASVRVEPSRYAPVPTVAVITTPAPAPQGVRRITFYENENFGGRTFTTNQEVGNFGNFGFNDRASSVVVAGDRWEVCADSGYRGHCVVLRPGRYASLASMGLQDRVSSVRLVDDGVRIEDNRYAPSPGVMMPPPAPPPVVVQSTGQVKFYENDNFTGRSFTTDQQIGNFQRYGFNDRASSVIVTGERWEVCVDANYRGRCVVLRPGRYPSLATMGLRDRISSVRIVESNVRIIDSRYAPAPVMAVDYRRRADERLYQADVTSVHAVLAVGGRQCWMEREQVVQDRGNTNVPGAIAGAVIGGIIGHQFGGGTGKDVATAGGAVAGAVVGGNMDGGGRSTYSQDVQRCSSGPAQGRPEYWDVTYSFRGQEHRMQMSTPPGRTVTVNNKGEPRA
jgi:uncharacterized protein YcfJ